MMSCYKWDHSLDEAMAEIPNCIEKCLYLGSRSVASSPDWLEALSVKVIVTFGSRPLDRRSDDGIFHFYNRWDRNRPYNMLFMLNIWNDWIEACVDKQWPILINCDRDYSISAMMVMAYMMRKYKWTRMLAWNYVRGRCPMAGSNIDFNELLDLYRAMNCRIDETNLKYRTLVDQGLLDPASMQISIHQKNEELKNFKLYQTKMTNKPLTNMTGSFANVPHETDLMDNSNQNTNFIQNDENEFRLRYKNESVSD